VTRNKGSLLPTGEKRHSGNSHSPGMQRRQVVCTYCVLRLQRAHWVRADRGGGYVRGYTVYRGEKVLFQDSQNLGSQGSLDMYTLHEVNTKLYALMDNTLVHLLSYSIVN
jgi:hypothetical protein